MIEIIAMTLTTLSHTTIWQLTHMPGADTSRIDQKLIVETTL